METCPECGEPEDRSLVFCGRCGHRRAPGDDPALPVGGPAATTSGAGATTRHRASWALAGVVAVAAGALVVATLGARPSEEVVQADRVDASGVTSSHAVVPERIAWSAPGAHDVVVFGDRRAVPVAVVDDVLVIESEGVVRGVDLDTGDTRYEVASHCCATAAGDTIVLPRGTSVVSLDATTGEVRHEAGLAGPPGYVASVTDGVAVVHRADGALTGVELASGERRWEWQPPLGDRLLRTMADGDLLTLQDGSYVWIDARTGAVSPVGFDRSPFSHLLYASREVLVELRPGSGGSEPVVLDLVSGRSIHVRDAGFESWHERPAAVGVTEDEVILHRAGPGAERMVVSRASGAARWEEASGVSETFAVSRGFEVDNTWVLWRTDRGATVVDADTLQRRPVPGFDARNVRAVGDHVVLEQERTPDGDHGGASPWRIIDERGRRVADVRLRDLPPPPAGWQGRRLRLLQRPDGTILDPQVAATHVRGRIDGATVGQRRSHVVAATAAGDVSVTGTSITLEDEDGEVRWSTTPDRDRNRRIASATVLNEHVVTLRTPSQGPVGAGAPHHGGPTTVATYRLADGEPVDELELPPADTAPHELAVRDGTLWLTGARLARVEVADDGELTLRWSVEPQVTHGVGDVTVEHGVLWSVGPWAFVRWDAATGRELDPVPLPVPVDESGVLHDGRLFAVSGRTLVGIDVESGRLAWEVDLPAWPTSQVAVAGDRAYVGLEDGTLVTVTTDGGDDRHEVSAGDSAIVGRPLVARGQVLVVVQGDPTVPGSRSSLVALVPARG